MPGVWPIVVVCLVWAPVFTLARSASRGDPDTGLRVPPSPEVTRYEQMVAASAAGVRR
jgi:hypothetical protein